MDDKIKVGVIGVGMMGQSQIRNCFEKLDDFEVTTICDNYKPHIDKTIEYFKSQNKEVLIFEDYKKMLKEAPVDLIAIVTPDYLHEEMAIECLKYNKHVRLEKPMALTVDGCKKILEAYEKSNKILQIGLELRYAKIISEVKKRINDIGKLQMIWCQEFRPPFLKKEGLIPDWITMKKYSGGTLIEKNCHHFDLFNLFANSKPISVYASGGNDIVYTHTDVLDNAYVTVEYENNIRCMLSLCLFSPEISKGSHLKLLKLGFMGSTGRIDIEDDNFYLWDRDGKTELKYSFFRNNFEAHSEDINFSLVDLANSIKSNRQPYTNAYVGLDSILLSEAAEISAKEKRIVFIDELEKKYGVKYFIANTSSNDK